MSAATFTDILFDSEPIGLADAFAPLAAPATIRIESDTEAQAGEVIYFGLASETSEILEVKAKVQASASNGELYHLTVEVMEVDAAMKDSANAILCPSPSGNADAKQPVWAIGLKQTNGAYAMLVNSPAGLLTAPQLACLAEVSADGAGVAKLTHAQRIILLMPQEKMDAAKAKLADAGLQVGVLHKGVRNIRACCGALCRFAQDVNALELAQTLDKTLFGRGTEFDIKIAVSDCLRNCSESFCSDIGLIGGKGTYKMVVGGRGSQTPFRAIQIAQDLKTDEIPAAIVEVIDWYEKHADKNERFWKLLQRMGTENAKSADLSSLESSLATVGDGIDETARMRDQLARMAGARQLREALSFTARS